MTSGEPSRFTQR